MYARFSSLALIRTSTYSTGQSLPALSYTTTDSIAMLVDIGVQYRRVLQLTTWIGSFFCEITSPHLSLVSRVAAEVYASESHIVRVKLHCASCCQGSRRSA